MSIRVLTKLDAVNLMLRNIGEEPVSSLTDTGLADAVSAESTLDDVSRSIQAEGLRCNTIWGFETTPTHPTPGRITLPATTLIAQADGSDRYKDVSVWAEDDAFFLYDHDNNTDQFTEGVKIKLTTLKEFKDLSPVARDYITIEAAKAFAAVEVGSTFLQAVNAREARRIESAFNSIELNSGRKNIFTGKRASYSMGRIVQGRRN